MSQPTLFDVGPARPVKPRVVKQTPVWTNNTTRATCYDCIAQLAAGQFITPLRAQWKRTAGDETGSYCYEHATPRRDADHRDAMTQVEPVARRAASSTDAWKTREEPTWLDSL